MMVRARCWLLLVGFILALPLLAGAQDATLSGTITDSTGAVLPGVTVTATHEASGNVFTSVTDERGTFRIPVRTGPYQVKAELQGFTTLTRTGLQLLVGQTATINLQMAPSSLQETVTVTAEVPLLNVTSSTLGGNIDPRQVQELPVQGRNWLNLAMLAPGSRMNSPAQNVPLPDRNGGEQREFQFTIDGQQVASELGFGGQPRYSQESIAEFQFISNRFDATMGRSSGVQVKAVTRAGTNTLTGSLRGNFRDSRLNASNPVLNRVVPIDNQQLAYSMGGPIVKDRVHAFGYFEYEREPRSSIWNTPYPAFNVELKGKNTVKMGGLRLDYQLSPKARLMGKASEGRAFQPFGLGDQSHPAATGSNGETNREYLVQLTNVLSNRALNEVKVGYSKWIFENANLTNWSKHWQAGIGVTTGSPRINFNGFSIGGNTFFPRFGSQDIWSVRDDFSFSYSALGRHDLKVGFDYLRQIDAGNNCQLCMGQVDARNTVNGATIPTPAQLQAWFPDPFNADTWNMAAISPWVRTYIVGVGNYATKDTRPQFGTWLQDDWQITPKLTVNMGVRYDLSVNANGNHYAIPPFVEAGRPNDTNNLQPRVGFAYKLNDATVLRAGSGTYFAVPLSVETFWMAQASRIALVQITNDGRPNFAADPFNGQAVPSYDQAVQRFCSTRNVPGCLQRAIQELMGPDKYTRDLARTWQNSVGIARQLGSTMAVEADYVYTQGRHEKDILDNVNLTFNPATGANYPFSDVARRAFPDYGVISLISRTGWSGYHALQTSLTKRMSHRWQASATYTLSGLKDAEARPHSGLDEVPFPTVPDLGGEYTYASSDQRHRAVFNGIWQLGHGTQIGSVFYLGVGERAQTAFGADLRGLSAGASAQALRRQRLRRDGTIVPRNSFTQPARKRFDLRAQQRIPLPGHITVDGIAEVFNLFNSPNWTVTTLETSPLFGKNTAAENRSAQVGFRLTF